MFPMDWLSLSARHVRDSKLSFPGASVSAWCIVLWSQINGQELNEESVWSEEWCRCASCELERCEHGHVTHGRLLLKMILC